MSATESMDIVDKLTAIDLKAATSAGEIAEGLAQFANIGSLMGVNIDQAASYVATIADVTQMSGSSAGQAMKMIISRYGNVKAGAFSRSNLDASAENGEAINDVERVLNKLGITMRKSHSQFKDFDETLEEIAGKWSTLDNISQKAIATAFAGVRQQEAFITLMQNWDKYQELLAVSETSKGTATRKYEAYQEGLAAATKRLTTTVEDLVNKQQIGGLLTSLVDVLTDIGENWLPNLVKYIPQLIFLIQDIRALRGTSWLNRLGDKTGGVSGIGKLLFGESTEQSRILFHRKQETAEVAKQAKLEQEKTQEEMKQNAAEKDSTVQDVTQNAAEKDSTVQDVTQNAAEKDSTVQDVTQNAAGKTGGGGGVSKTSAIMSGLTIPLMSLAGWFMGKSTANRSHTNRLGETVTSSKYAAARGSSVEAAWSALPFIGTFIGSAVSDSLMAEIDKIYDEVRITTEKAQEAVTVLTKIGSSVSSLSGLANSLGYEDMIEANRIADEMLAELYSAEGEESRRTIEKYLPSVGGQLRSMSSLLEEFKNESYEGRKQIVDELELAQLKAQHEQERLAQEQEEFEQEQSYQESLKESLGNIEQYAQALGLTSEQNGSAIGSGLLAGLPMTGGFAGGGALTGMLIGGPLGALIGTLAGTLLGGIISWFTSGSDVRESIKDSYLAENAAAFASARTPKDLIEELQKLEKEIIKRIDENDSNISDEDYEDLANVRKAIEATQEYQNYLFTAAQTNDRRIAKEALLETIGSSGDTIRNMSLGQLKRMGTTQVYEAFAKQVMKNGGLSTISPFANGTITQDFINMVTSMLREDPELDLLLSGAAYTVKEASELSRSDLFDERVMQQFAMALHITVDDLGQIAEIIPDLKLADLLKSTAELEESVDNYQKLFSSLRSGTSETSKWMTEITNQFPELVAYMDDIPTLMGKIISRMKQLNQVVILQQFDELKSSPEAFQERFLPDILAYVLQNAGRDMLVQVQELIDKETITSAADVQRYLASNPQNEVSQWLEKAARNMGSDYDLTADLLKPEWKQYTTYIADLWKKQLENLEAQKNMLSEMSKQREYEINLLKAQLKLQETMNEKQRIYRAGVGWVYEADQGKIQEAKKELEDLEVTKQISEITKQINEVQYMVTKWESIWEIREKERVEEEVKAFMKAMGIENEEGIFGGKYSTALQNVFGLGEGTTIYTLFNDTISGIKGLPSAFATEMNKILDKDKQDRSEAMTRIDTLDTKLRWADMNPNQIGAGEYNTWLSEYTNAVKDAKSRGFISSAEYDDYIARHDRKDVSNPAYKVSQAYTGQNVSAEAQNILDYFAQQSAGGFADEARPLQISQAKDGSYYISFKEQNNSDLRRQGYLDPSTLRTNSNGELIFDTGKKDERPLTLPESSLKLISLGRTKDGGASYLYQYDPLGEVLSSDEIGQILLSTSVAASPLYDTITASEFRNKFAESRIFFNNNGEGTILPATSNNLPQWLQFSSKDSGFQSYFKNRASNEDFFIEVDGAWYFISRGKAYLAKTARDMAAFAYMQGDSWLLGDPNGEANYSKLGSGALGTGVLSGALAVAGIASNASGGYLPVSTRSFVNELGTEAIVTPQGTITSLPGHTGIVPADITANLWALGEVAPNLLRAFGDTIMSRNGLIPASASTDESFNIGNLTMNVSADKSFDAEAFVQSIKDRVALTKNTRR